MPHDLIPTPDVYRPRIAKSGIDFSMSVCLCVKRNVVLETCL